MPMAPKPGTGTSTPSAKRSDRTIIARQCRLCRRGAVSGILPQVG